MNDAPSDVPETDEQREVLAAYGRSRARFDAWCDRPPPANQPGEVDRTQLRHLAYRHRRRPMGSDAVEAMHLVGALARLDGGQSIADAGHQVTKGDLLEGWIGTLIHAGDLAGTYKLAFSPLLDMADRLGRDRATVVYHLRKFGLFERRERDD